MTPIQCPVEYTEGWSETWSMRAASVPYFGQGNRQVRKRISRTRHIRVRGWKTQISMLSVMQHPLSGDSPPSLTPKFNIFLENISTSVPATRLMSKCCFTSTETVGLLGTATSTFTQLLSSAGTTDAWSIWGLMWALKGSFLVSMSTK